MQQSLKIDFKPAHVATRLKGKDILTVLLHYVVLCLWEAAINSLVRLIRE